jgi:predicted small integral membrane protein
MNCIFRLSKLMLVAAVGFTISLVAVNNLTDYNANWAFVTHVLSMDTAASHAAIQYRAVTSPLLQMLAYWLIIAAETLAAALCWVGAFALLRALRGSRTAFDRAKAPCIAGLTLGFLIWQFGFMAIGGEWFEMWQSPAWNGVPSAFRFHITILVVLIYLSLPEFDERPRAHDCDTDGR